MKNHGRTNPPYNIYLDSIIFWIAKSGGVSTYWIALIEYLSSVGVSFFQTYQNAECLSIYNKKIRKYPPSSVELFYPNISRYLSAKIATPVNGMGIFHSSYYRTCSQKGLANVVTVHDFTYERYRKGLPRIVHTAQKLFSIRNADIVICVSNNTKTDLMKFVPDFDTSRIRVIHHGVSDEFHRLNKNEIFSEIEFNQSYILFVGERRGYKRFDLAVSAIENISQLKLLIIGKEISSREKESLDEILPGRWQYAGQVSVKKLNELYNGAFALIYPSDYEGFGMPVLEAMKAGCPVVCSSNSSLPEIAGNAAICVPEQNTDAYSLALESLFDTDLRNRLINNGLEHSEKFTWSKCFEKTLDAYNDAIKIRYK